ncbi:hypothetical protein BC937DRAFT_92390 [Endogone sp. FLAS-F59071]|nr:hypothetical protein BC937DRAFT_92390 [Endogone sp. FLAS-F59071]|eukprot:RUS15480.1 hypothetical protein BC937DRAFT_92390 [Endogone sp. FLAS-F59071]
MQGAMDYDSFQTTSHSSIYGIIGFSFGAYLSSKKPYLERYYPSEYLLPREKKFLVKRSQVQKKDGMILRGG